MNGKYYWVKTLDGVEIGLKRDSGIWELCGVDVTVDINEAIIEVLGEVSEWSSNEKEQALHKHIVSNNEVAVCLKAKHQYRKKYRHFKYCPDCGEKL